MIIFSISPTHKRIEGRAPVRGSEFTTKVAALQGGSAEIDHTLNLKFWDPVTGSGGVLPLLNQILFSNLLEPSRSI